jgi:hypothetical protein
VAGTVSVGLISKTIRRSWRARGLQEEIKCLRPVLAM